MESTSSFTEIRRSGLRPHDQARPERRFREPLVQVERGLLVRVQPLLILGNRALDDRHRHGRTRRVRPFDGPQREQRRATEPRTRPRQRFASAGSRAQRRSAPAQTSSTALMPYTPAMGAKPRQPGVSLRIAERQPGEARQKPTAPPFHQQPRCRHCDHPSHARPLRKPPRHDIAESGVIQRP